MRALRFAAISSKRGTLLAQHRVVAATLGLGLHCVGLNAMSSVGNGSTLARGNLAEQPLGPACARGRFLHGP